MSNILLSDDRFEYKVIEPTHEKEFLTMIADVFSKYEALISYLNTPIDITEELMTNALNWYKARELTVVCIEKSTQTVCAGFLCCQTHPDYPHTVSERVSKFLVDFFKFLNGLDSEFQNLPIDLSQGCYQFCIAAKKEFAGNKIGENLTLCSIELAKRHRLLFVHSELTSPISQHFFQKLGYTVLKQVTHADYEVDGQKAFEKLLGFSQLVIKYIN